MAKRSKRRYSRQVPRDLYNSYRYTRSAVRTLSSARSLVLSPLRLLPLGDGRFFNPTVTRAFAPVAAQPRAAARLVATRLGVRFASPRGVVTCVRRQIRKQVLFALGVGGQGGAKNKPRRTSTSGISC